LIRTLFLARETYVLIEYIYIYKLGLSYLAS